MARQLRKAGWPNARALVGGWHAWVDAGMPVEARPADTELVPLTRGLATT